MNFGRAIGISLRVKGTLRARVPVPLANQGRT